MSFLSRWFGGEKRQDRTARMRVESGVAGGVRSAPRQTRSLKAALENRLTADWHPGGGDINQEIRANIVRLRNRARDQELNSNFVRRYLRMVEIHVVGPNGYQLQVRGKLANGKPDTRNNQRVEKLLQDWGSSGGCEATGRLSFGDVQRLVVRTVARDGEALVRIWTVQPSQANPLGLMLELLDVARLDHTLHQDLRNGNRVRMGVELDQRGKAIAYWLLTNLAGDSVFQTQQQRHERVPAEDLLHLFHSERAEQTRGLTWMTAPMLKLHQLDAYSDAAITAARVGASKMGFFESANDGLAGHAVADSQDIDGEYYTSAEPGEFGVLPKGWKFNPFNPDYPAANYDPFTKAALREAASGFDVSYHGMTGDLRDVNFSSIRAGTLEEREHWMTRQQWLADALLKPLYYRALGNIALFGLLGGVDAAVVLERFRAHFWQPRRWQWVDPFKDINTAKAAVDAGFKSPQQVAAEQGMDIEDVLDQIAAFQQMVKDKGVILPGQAAAVQDANQGASDANNN